MIFMGKNGWGKRGAAMVGLAALILSPVVVGLRPAWAQSGSAKMIKCTLVFTRAGTYQCYPIINGSRAEGISIKPGESELPIEVSPKIEGVEVLDEVSGLVASITVRRLKRAKKINVEPSDFDKLQAVKVILLSKNGEPAAKGVIRLTPSEGEPLQYGLTTMDNGTVEFSNVPLGKASVKGNANTGDDSVKQSVIIAPAVGGGPFVITLTLPIDVRTVKPAPVAGETTVATNNEGKPAPAKNDWTSGIVGLALLGAGGFFGFRYLQSRNMTPKEAFGDALTRLGVDTPGADVPGLAHAGLRPVTPDVVSSPLPSLSDLPGASDAAPALPGTHLVGLAGAVAGQNIAMTSEKETMVSVGRDTKCTIPLPNDSMVSRRHAVFVASGTGWELLDEASTNGTFLNGKRIENRTALMSGDEIQIGMARFRFVGEKRATNSVGKPLEA